jgi:putative heme iron utilization protein
MTELKKGEAARRLMESERHGVLCTISREIAGWPFGSIAPYAISNSGDPILLISEIAEHTRNLRADSRSSLLIADSTAVEDPQAAARITLIGHSREVEAGDLDEVQGCYFERFPKSKTYFDVHDFSFFVIRIERARFIGGFGAIYWLDPAEIFLQRRAPDALAPFAAEICHHMNTDHAEALILYCKAYAQRETNTARMTRVDSGGFNLEIPAGNGGETVRIPFPHPVLTPEDARHTMIDMLRLARASSR